MIYATWIGWRKPPEASLRKSRVAEGWPGWTGSGPGDFRAAESGFVLSRDERALRSATHPRGQARIAPSARTATRTPRVTTRWSRGRRNGSAGSDVAKSRGSATALGRTGFMKARILVPVLSALLWTGCFSNYSGIPAYDGAAPGVPLEMGAASEPAVSPGYKMQPGDRIQIRSQYHDELEGESTIGPDGQIAVPALGQFQAVGLSPDELAADIMRRAS